MRYEIVDPRLEHVREMARTMRAEDRSEIEALGLVVRHTLFRLYRHSAHFRVWVADGQVAGLLAIDSPILSDEGLASFFTSPIVERGKFAFIKEARVEIDRMMGHYRKLTSFALASYHKSVRTFSLLGFVAGDPFPFGPYGALHRRLVLERR